MGNRTYALVSCPRLSGGAPELYEDDFFAESPPDSGDDGRIAAICRFSVERAGVDGMSVSVADMFHSLEQIFATDALAVNLVDLEFAVGQGPALDCLAFNRPVAAIDLSTETAMRRWPLFAPEAIAIGVLSIHSFPLSITGRSLGAVAMYRRGAGSMTPEEQNEAAAAAELINLAMLAPGAQEGITDSLTLTVHQAAGMVMQQTGVSIEDALVLLKATAFAENRLVAGLADEVVNGGRRFSQTEHDDDKS